MDGARISALQRLHSQVGRVEFWYPDVGDGNIGKYPLSQPGGARSGTRSQDRTPVAKAIPRQDGPLQIGMLF